MNPMEVNKFHLGDCLSVLRDFEANSIDTVITDPPYGLTFMGKDWDNGVPGEAYWREMSRVAKPGASLLAFGGTRTFHRLTCSIEDAGWEIRDCLMWLYGQGFPKSRNLHGEFEGWGTALKPAWEPIIVAMKPAEGTFAENAETWGVSGINIAESRIGTAPRHNKPVRGHKNSMIPYEGKEGPGTDVVGRWPANLILDKEAAKALDEQSGTLTSGKVTKVYSAIPKESASLGKKNRHLSPASVFSDSGGASRFFYTAKASKSERGQGNNHPTVKPLKLMEYLCTLTKTPTGGIVLDPFAGSGTTLLAARNTGRSFIGIEKDPQYVEIITARLNESYAK